MAFEVSVSEKDRLETVRADGQWSGPRTIAGVSSWPVTIGNKEFSLDLYGLQAAASKDRIAGNLRVRWIRLPSGDVFGYDEIPIDPKFVDWCGSMQVPRVAVVGKLDEIAWEIKTHVAGLRLRDRVLIVARLP